MAYNPNSQYIQQNSHDTFTTKNNNATWTYITLLHLPGATDMKENLI